MDLHALLVNLTSPSLLYFLLGVLATVVKSDLELPVPTIKFISLYLLFSIGFKGGQELAHSGFTPVVLAALGAALGLAVLVPLYTYFLARRVLDTYNAGALAAAYGSVSAVTFITASSFLDDHQVAYGGHMVAAMALMEAPAIIIGLLLIRRFAPPSDDADAPRPAGGLGTVAHEAFTNGSVLMIVGSLVIGLLADSKAAEGIKPFTSDIFKGFLAVFLLEMGMVAARRFGAFRRAGWGLVALGLVLPAVGAALGISLSHVLHLPPGDGLLLTVLAASASYIAVPAALRLALPQADPGIYLPMALAVTFPFNIAFGIPLYFYLPTP
ncbi:MAG: sodium-dependent bicarbonate transport family permease [Hymenobacteraceae bacterium]|nr:sodium-dependent bicarbonate transport family permease [Hymenobacteraceae bacterium]